MSSRITFNIACSALVQLTTRSLQWRYNGRDSVSNHQPRECLFTQPFNKAQIKENIKVPRHWPFVGYSPETGEFPHKGPVTRKMFPFDDVIICWDIWWCRGTVMTAREINVRLHNTNLVGILAGVRVKVTPNHQLLKWINFNLSMDK